MVAGTSIVWLPVSDIDRSIAFYRDRLRLNQLQHEGDWAQLDANGLHIGLNARESPTGNGGAVIAFQPETGLTRPSKSCGIAASTSPETSAITPGGASQPSRTLTATIYSSTSLPAKTDSEWDAHNAASHSPTGCRVVIRAECATLRHAP